MITRTHALLAILAAVIGVLLILHGMGMLG